MAPAKRTRKIPRTHHSFLFVHFSQFYNIKKTNELSALFLKKRLSLSLFLSKLFVARIHAKRTVEYQYQKKKTVKVVCVFLSCVRACEMAKPIKAHHAHCIALHMATKDVWYGYCKLREHRRGAASKLESSTGRTGASSIIKKNDVFLLQVRFFFVKGLFILKNHKEIIKSIQLFLSSNASQQTLVSVSKTPRTLLNDCKKIFTFYVCYGMTTFFFWEGRFL